MPINSYGSHSWYLERLSKPYNYNKSVDKTCPPTFSEPLEWFFFSHIWLFLHRHRSRRLVPLTTPLGWWNAQFLNLHCHFSSGSARWKATALGTRRFIEVNSSQWQSNWPPPPVINVRLVSTRSFMEDFAIIHENLLYRPSVTRPIQSDARNGFFSRYTRTSAIITEWINSISGLSSSVVRFTCESFSPLGSREGRC